MEMTIAKLRAFAPHAAPWIIDGIASHWGIAEAVGITTPRRVRQFLANVATETGGLAKLEENLNYSAKRLCEVWPARFRTLAHAQPYAYAPVKLANFVYGGRLGNKMPNDGWDFRGSGLLQTTGRANFTEVERVSGLPVTTNPALLRAFPSALEAACIFWDKRKLNEIADRDDTDALRRAINGGLNGIVETHHWLTRALAVWPDGDSIGAGLDQPVLRRGDKGAAVGMLQALLNKNGATLTVDEDFGADTEKAVKAFQRSKALKPVDGIAGKDTWAGLLLA